MSRKKISQSRKSNHRHTNSSRESSDKPARRKRNKRRNVEKRRNKKVTGRERNNFIEVTPDIILPVKKPTELVKKNLTLEETETAKLVLQNKRDRHHRKARSLGGTNIRSNISKVRTADHQAFHRLFGPGLVQNIAEILNAIWIDPDYELVFRKREKDTL
jgi:hypothetical protein